MDPGILDLDSIVAGLRAQRARWRSALQRPRQASTRDDISVDGRI